MTWTWEKGAQELHVFSRNQDHMYNTQMGIKIWFHICKQKILLFKNHLHSGLSRVNRKTTRIWSKQAKDCLNVPSAREPTCISPMGIQKIFCIFKPIIKLLPNSLHSGWSNLGLEWREVEKKGTKNYTSSLAIKTTYTTLQWDSKYDFIFGN